jgi:hypothetical protein
MFPRPAGQKPAGVQRVCACLSVFFHFGDMKGAARIYIYTPPSCLIYIQSRGALVGPPIFHVSLIFYIPLISMLIMAQFSAKKECAQRLFGAFIISLFKRRASPFDFLLFISLRSLRQGHFELRNYNSTKSLSCSKAETVFKL